MKTYPRKRQQYLFASVLGVIGVVNLLFFFILYQPTRSEYFRLQDSILKARTEVQARGLKIDRLEKLSAQLETSTLDRQRLFSQHFISKDTGWSEIVPQLDAMVRLAGVKNSRKDYSIGESPQYGLYSVKIGVPVSGLYSNLMNFIKEIENSDTLFIIESVDVRGGATPGVLDISMNLNLETFFYK